MASENTKVNTNTPVSPVELWGLAAKTQQLALGQISSLIKDGPVDTHDPLDLARPYTALLGHWSRQPLQAVEVIEKAGGSVSGVLAVVDREEGGREAIEDLGYPVRSLVTLTDLGVRPG